MMYDVTGVDVHHIDHLSAKVGKMFDTKTLE